MPDTADTVAARIARRGGGLRASRWSRALPDGWITDLITPMRATTASGTLRSNREESAIGLCSGAYLGGIGAMALMGASGFLTCIYALTKINYTYQIPILIGITLRGRPGDGAKFHQSNGLYLEPVIQSIDMPFIPIERRRTFRDRRRLCAQPDHVASGRGRLHARSCCGGQRMMHFEDCFRLLHERLKTELIVTSAGNCSELWWEITRETERVFYLEASMSLASLFAAGIALGNRRATGRRVQAATARSA